MIVAVKTLNAVRNLAIACASIALVVPTAQAQGRHSGGGGHFAHSGRQGFGHGHHRGSGWGWGGWGLGLGIGLGWGLSNHYYYDYPYRGYVVVDPPVVYDSPRPVPPINRPDPAQAPAPVIYPRIGQDAARIESDSDACSQWAGLQPNATTDPSVFRRGIEACMDARGYTLR